MESRELLDLSASDVAANNNIRFNLKPERIRHIADSIKERGVLEPIGVEALHPPADGKLYRIVYGHYRHAAVQLLHEEGIEVLLPALVILTPGSVQETLLTQVAENLEREEPSPMDTAVAIRKLLDAGVSRSHICTVFARPAGKKGERAPASNAWVNIMLNLLDLPKRIQNKIHDGTIGVGAAYELGRVDADKREAVVARAEAERDKWITKKARDEEQYQKAELKKDGQAALAGEISQARELAQVLQETHAGLVQQVSSLECLSYGDETREAKRTAELQKLKEAEKRTRKESKAAANILAKLLAKAAPKAPKAPEEKPKPNKTITKKEIQEAAKKEGAAKAPATLSLSEFKRVLKDLAKGGNPVIIDIVEGLMACLDGVLSTKELLAHLEGVTEPSAPADQETEKVNKVKKVKKVKKANTSK